MSEKLIVKEGYVDAGKVGVRVGKNILVGGLNWVPIVWEGEEDPDFFKSAGLEPFVNRFPRTIAVAGNGGTAACAGTAVVHSDGTIAIKLNDSRAGKTVLGLLLNMDTMWLADAE